MSRLLFTCWPFVGHVLPQLSIASALRAAGHEVAFYTGPTARALIEPEGFEVFGFDHVDEDAAYGSMSSREGGSQPGLAGLRDTQRTLREWLVETIPAQLADTEPILAAWKPDVVVTDLSMWAPIVILWEATPVPVVLSSTFMGPMTPGRDAPPFGFGLKPPTSFMGRLAARALSGGTDLAAKGLRRRVDELRADRGLPPLGCSVNAFTGRLPLYLVGTIPELDYDRADVPASVSYVGPCIWNPPPSPDAAAWLDAVATGRPWVHVTESTLRHGDPFLLRAAARGLGGAPLEVILTTGRQREASSLDLGPLTSNVHVTPWLNHTELLPRCAAMVTAGGTGSVMAALRAAVPLVVVPSAWDQPDNARRVVEAGVGVRLAPRRCTPEALRAAVEHVLGDPGFAERARRIADRLADSPGPGGAAALLASVAGRVAAGGGR